MLNLINTTRLVLFYIFDNSKKVTFVMKNREECCQLIAVSID